MKIINKIILDEKDFLTLKNRKIDPDPIQYGTAFEKILKQFAYFFSYKFN